MVHNTAVKAAEAFQHINDFDAEDMLTDLYYWLDKSTNGKMD